MQTPLSQVLFYTFQRQKEWGKPTRETFFRLDQSLTSRASQIHFALTGFLLHKLSPTLVSVKNNTSHSSANKLRNVQNTPSGGELLAPGPLISPRPSPHLVFIHRSHPIIADIKGHRWHPGLLRVSQYRLGCTKALEARAGGYSIRREPTRILSPPGKRFACLGGSLKSGFASHQASATRWQ